MTKNERIACLEAEVAGLKVRLSALEIRPEPYNPWTPIGPRQNDMNFGYTCQTCHQFVSYLGGSHYCSGSSWWGPSYG